MSNCFYFALWSRSSGMSAKTYQKWSFSGIFSRLGLFSQVFMHIKVWLILELHKMIRVPHVWRSQLFLFCFMIEIDREKCSKLWKMTVFSVFSLSGPFPQVLGQVKVWLMWELRKMMRVSHVVAYPIIFFVVVLWERLAGRSVQSYEKWSFFSVFNSLDPFPDVFRQVKQ